MADFQYPDLLGSYVRGQMAPGQLQAQQQGLQAGQQELTEGGLKIDQLRLALGNQQMYQQVARQSLQGQGYLGGAPSQGAQNIGGPTGGVQNGPQAPTQGDGGLGFTPTTLGALALLRGDDPLKTAQGVQEYQLKQKQIQLQGPMNLAESVGSATDAAQIVMNNPSLQQSWMKAAPALGLNPFRDLTDANARRAAIFSYNQLAGQAGLPAKPMPDQLQDIHGAYGQLLQRSALTGKETEVTPQKLPTQTMEKRHNPQTGKDEGLMVMTSAGGVATPTAPGQAGRGGGIGGGRAPGSIVGNTVDLGMPAPTTENIKQVGFAATMRDGLQGMRTLEAKGIALTPVQRAQVIDVATKDDMGSVHQLMAQEGLKHGLSHDAQTYLASMMPVIQAVSHDQSGARLNASQIRTNLESVIPVDVKNADAMTMINKTRDNFQNAMNVGAGSAAYTPEFRGSVGAQRTAVQQGIPQSPKGMPSLDDIQAELTRRRGSQRSGVIQR